jgi:hypothetical protein
MSWWKTVLESTCDAITSRLKSYPPLTTFGTNTVGATVVNGVTWEDLDDETGIPEPVRLYGITLTVAGGWAGKAVVRVVDRLDVKIWPAGAEIVQDTDFTSGVRLVIDPEIFVTVEAGYKIQFRSDNAGDGAGKTLALTADYISLS